MIINKGTFHKCAYCGHWSYNNDLHEAGCSKNMRDLGERIVEFVEKNKEVKVFDCARELGYVVVTESISPIFKQVLLNLTAAQRLQFGASFTDLTLNNKKYESTN